MLRLAIISFFIITSSSLAGAQTRGKSKKVPQLKSKICLEWKDGNSPVKDHYDTITVERFYRDSSIQYSAAFNEGKITEKETHKWVGKGKSRTKVGHIYRMSLDTLALVESYTYHEKSRTETESFYYQGKRTLFNSWSPKTRHRIDIGQDGMRTEALYDPKTKVQTEYMTTTNGDTVSVTRMYNRTYAGDEKLYKAEIFGQYPDTTTTWRAHYERDNKGELLSYETYDQRGMLDKRVNEFDGEGRVIKESYFHRADTIHKQVIYTYSDLGTTKNAYNYKVATLYLTSTVTDTNGDLVSELRTTRNGDTLSYITHTKTTDGLIIKAHPNPHNKGVFKVEHINAAGLMALEVKGQNYSDTTHFVRFTYDDKHRLLTRNGYRVIRARRAPILHEVIYEKTDAGERKTQRMERSTTVLETDESGKVLLKISINPRGDTTNVETFMRDEAGRILEETETRWGYKTRYEYNKQGHLTLKEKIDPYGRVVTIRKYIYEYY